LKLQNIVQYYSLLIGLYNAATNNLIAETYKNWKTKLFYLKTTNVDFKTSKANYPTENGGFVYIRFQCGSLLMR